MQKLIEGVKQIHEVMDQWGDILTVNFNQRELAQVHVYARSFKEVVESLELLPCYVEMVERKDCKYPIELRVQKDDVVFLAIMTEHDYEMDFREWIYEEPNIDEEFLTETSPMPENERLMKAAGHKMHDFI